MLIFYVVNTIFRAIFNVCDLIENWFVYCENINSVVYVIML
jgi:hypothetical protein